MNDLRPQATHRYVQSSSSEVELLFCCMPWAASSRPSLPLGLLKGICDQEGIGSKVIYSNFDLSAKIGIDLAEEFATKSSLQGLSEHLFACSLFGKDVLDSDRFIRKYSELPGVLDIVPKDFWFHARDEVIPKFLTATADRLLDHSPSIIGFSATFNQVMSSLAAARIVKDRKPDTITIFGGALFQDPMGQEYHRACSKFVDHVFFDEADDSFRTFICHWKNRAPLKEIPGVTYKNGKGIEYLPSEPVTDLNRLPVPNYDDYYLEAERLKDDSSFDFLVDFLPYESSRGCWWGQKSQCTFCGLPKGRVIFRNRDPERIVEDIITLSRKYQETSLYATDSIISWPTLTPVLQQLVELGLDLELFYEVKASIKKEQFELLKNAGVCRLQSGIESFSTDALQLMAKGTSLLINLQFLKWAKEYGLQSLYNLLIGLPNEKPEWYDNVIELIPMFCHLQPPNNELITVSLHRYSPLYERKEIFGLGTLLSRPDLLNCFPPGTIDLNKCSYFFYEKETVGKRFLFERKKQHNHFKSPDYMQRFRQAVSEWIQLHQTINGRPSLSVRLGEGFAKICDERTSPGREYTVSDEYLDIILMCDRIQVRSSLERRLGKKYSQPMITEAIDELLAREVLIQEKGKILSLAVADCPRSTSWLEATALGYDSPKSIEKRLKPMKGNNSFVVKFS